ncbi:kinase-like domain-containing protein [Aspergillus germanicus]
MVFRRRRRPGELPSLLAEQLLSAIGEGAGRFAPRDSLLRIWSVDVLEEFVFHERIHLPAPYTVEDLRTNFLQTLSILAYGHWTDWPRFDSIFLVRHSDRTDRGIPHYDIQTLANNEFLGPPAGNRFYDDRHLFCPIDVVENGNLTRDGTWKLPFLEGKSEPCGSGGFGRVTKQVIAARHYVSDGGQVSTTEKSVACKAFSSKNDFIRERNTLKALHDCQNQNARIVLPLATIVIGDQPNILFPLAEMDLDKFLSGALLSPERCGMSELLSELISLAGALVHLHTGLGLDIHGCHADLKCHNILVFPSPDSVVGKWMITDFGLSIIGPVLQRRDSGNALAIPPNTDMATLVQPGAFQAPEVRCGNSISRSSDIWSFGCIMIRVLAFKLDGVHGLEELDILRGKEDDGITDYAGGHDYFNREEPPILNPHIARWIENLPDKYPNYSREFLQGCADLLRLTLAIDKSERPGARSVQQLLGGLKSVFHTFQPRTPSQSSSSILSVQTPDSSVTNIVPPSDPNLGGTLQSEALFEAIKRSNLSRIETCLAEGVNIEKRDGEGNTPLGFAAGTGKTAIVQRLLEARAQVNARSAGGKTALMLASHQGFEDVVGLLLQNDADCQAYSDEGLTCLHYATWPHASAGLIRLLAPHFQSVDVPGKDPTEQTPLVSLIKGFVPDTAWEDKLRALVFAGAKGEAIDKFGKRPIDYARGVKPKRALERLQNSAASPVEFRRSSDSGQSRRSFTLLWRRARGGVTSPTAV